MGEGGGMLLLKSLKRCRMREGEGEGEGGASIAKPLRQQPSAVLQRLLRRWPHVLRAAPANMQQQQPAPPRVVGRSVRCRLQRSSSSGGGGGGSGGSGSRLQGA